MSNTLTSEEVRSTLSQIGKSTGDIARELGVSRNLVRDVIDGRLKGARGDAHKVAVALGMKTGMIVPDEMSISDAIKAARAQ